MEEVLHSANTQTNPRQRFADGFSALELLIVIAILMLVAAISLIAITGALRGIHAQTGANTTLQVLRRGRQMAIDQRTRIHVAFNKPATGLHSMTISQVSSSAAPVVLATIPLPSDVQFFADQIHFPVPPNTPDGDGNGKVAIDFEDSFSTTPGTDVYFMPDGSAQNALGNTINGVVYLEQTNYWQGARAISLFGATGRLRSWTLVQTGPGVYSWQ